jgi:hypothetical protein
MQTEDSNANGLAILDTESNPPHNKFDPTSSRSVIGAPWATVNVMRNVVILQEYAPPAMHERISSSEHVCLPIATAS